MGKRKVLLEYDYRSQRSPEEGIKNKEEELQLDEKEEGGSQVSDLACWSMATWKRRLVALIGVRETKRA